jgi:hypothetical protein
MGYNNTIHRRFPQMIKLGTQVKSKVHDDLTGSVVLLERSNNYAVVKTHIHDYEIMTVECFLSDLEVA